MTESEAIKILIENSCYECAQGTDSPVNCQYVECILAEATREGIRALEEVQQYRELTDRLKAIYGDQMTLKDMVDVMERIIREPSRKDPVNARILTYDEAAMWDEYRKIGTPEELKAASKYLQLVKKHGTVGKTIEACAEYEGIGTVEECRAAMEKQRRKLVKDTYGTNYVLKAGYCPVCGCGVTARWDYCQCCGQKLNWQV